MRVRSIVSMTLFVLLIAFGTVSAKYAHNVGITDWSSKNIGKIEDAIIDRSSIYFLGSNGLFGHMSKTTGKKNKQKINILKISLLN